jgi:hypothetical protein
MATSKKTATKTVAAKKTISSTSAKRAAKPAAEVKKAATKKTPARKSVASASIEAQIFQIYFEDWQRPLLDPAMQPFDNRGVKSELLEFDVFERLAQDARLQDAKLWGAVSWRFGEKTGLTGADLLKQIHNAPGYDVYFCNPHIENESVFHNMWLQGLTSHPHFVHVAKAVFDAAGLDARELTAIHPSSSYSSANYFVATPKFWRSYLSFIRKVLVAADKKLSPELRKILHSNVADPRGLHGGATYVPFIVERLFGYFMRTEGKGLKAFKLTLPKAEAGLNVHQKLLREMKDMAHKTNSPWLAACWVNYRNLFFSQTRTKAWCTKYLRAITPTDVHFV